MPSRMPGERVAAMGSQSQLNGRRVIFCNSKDRLERVLPAAGGVVRLLVLDPIGESRQIRDYVAGIEGSEEIERNEAVKSFRPSFKAKYIEMVAGLNRANHSFFWWAFYFTRKESLYTNFSLNVFFCCLIGDLMRQSPSSDLVVVTQDSQLIRQVTAWGDDHGFVSVRAMEPRWNPQQRVTSFIPLRIGYTVLRALQLWVTIKALCRRRARPGAEYTVIGTLLEEGCFSDNGRYNDVYFGELPEYMSREGLPVMVFGGVQRNSRRVLDSLRKQKTDFPVIPWPYYGSMLGMAKAAGYTILHYIRPIKLKGVASLDGFKVDYLAKEAMRRDFRTGHFFNNLWLYYSARELAKRVRVAASLFPYENRCWETMLAAGLASGGAPGRSIGYNHAAITPAHTNLLLGVDEADVIPLPSTIVTMGEATKGILEESGNYPQGMFRVGCALRQGRRANSSGTRSRNDSITKLLLVLATGFDEYVQAMRFLDRAFDETNSIEIGVRPHPAFPFDQALGRIGRLDLNYSLMGGPLEENLEWPDVVVYVSSTVGLTAISRGIPAVNIDLGEFMDYDPAPPTCPLKWSVSGPEELVPVLERIEAIADAEFAELQRQAREFGEQYFRPVTDESLNAFCKLIVDGDGPVA